VIPKTLFVCSRTLPISPETVSFILTILVPRELMWYFLRKYFDYPITIEVNLFMNLTHIVLNKSMILKHVTPQVWEECDPVAPCHQ
jgi:hypothetical protein